MKYTFRVEVEAYYPRQEAQEHPATWSREYEVATSAGNQQAAEEQVEDLIHRRFRLVKLTLIKKEEDEL